MNTKPLSTLVPLVLTLAIVLVTAASFAPTQIQAQGGSPTPVAPLPSPQIDPATGATSGMEPAAPSASVARFPGAAAFDSGWRAINPNQTLLLTHNLGGSVDNYVVDVRFLSASATMESHGYNQVAYGGNELAAPVPTGYTADDRVGAYWHSLNAASIKVYRMPDDKTYATMIRVRIWVVTDADYDSGWQSVAADSALALNHSLGGLADDYLVYLEFKDTGAGLGVHQRYYGGFALAGTSARVGAYWRALTNTSIQVYRRADEAYVDQVRVRIWKQPKPTYDSGWVNGSLGNYIFLTHAIGGNPDDYIVDLQFKDLTDGMGVNQRCYGGCDLRADDGGYANTKQGAYWRNLTRTGIEVGRRVNDVFADQVRVRIWNLWTPTRPDYDSGWNTTVTGSIAQPFHRLGGSEDDYLVNLVYWDSGWRANQQFYGLKYFGANPPTGYSADESAGAYWRSLTSSSVVVYRAPNDETVDQWRLRIWRMP